MKITTIGLDIAKRVFQAHGADATGKAVLRRKLQRAEVLAFFASLPPCVNRHGVGTRYRRPTGTPFRHRSACAAACPFGQRRCLKRQLSLPVSTMSQ